MNKTKEKELRPYEVQILPDSWVLLTLMNPRDFYLLEPKTTVGRIMDMVKTLSGL